MDGLGYDFGAAGVSVSVANPALAEHFGKAEVWGCGYGYYPPTATTPHLPMLAVIGQHPKPLRDGFAIMREWHDVGGPNAVNVEIAYSGSGYVIVINQDRRVLAWRTFGFGNFNSLMSLNMFWGKKMDSRQPILDEIARYMRAPVAPLQFCAGTARFGAPGGFELVPDCDPILLAHVGIYRDKDEIPPHSFLRHMIQFIGEGPQASEPADKDPEHWTPEKISRQRDQFLLGMLPKTMLVLRHREDGRQLVTSIIDQGFARWQAEQALANLRLAEVAANSPDRRRALGTLRQSYVEFAAQPYVPAEIELSAAVQQIEADLGFLLATLREGKVPKDLAGRMCMLQELGLA